MSNLFMETVLIFIRHPVGVVVYVWRFVTIGPLSRPSAIDEQMTHLHQTRDPCICGPTAATLL